MVLNEKKMPTFNEDFVKNHDEDTDKVHILEVDVKYPKHLHDLHSDVPTLPGKMKLCKCNKLVCNPCDKNNYFVHIRALKQALDHEIMLKKVQKVIQFNQEAWLRECIDMNTKLRTEVKNDFEKDFFKLMNNSVFVKTMQNEESTEILS